MLRLRWLALGLLLLPVSATAQFFDPTSITNPIRPDRAPLALTEEVPAIFHLGMNGPAPVFANPARAARAKHQFVYGTLRPRFSAESPVSFVGLFGEGDLRWLVTAENGVEASDRTDTQTRIRLDRPDGATTLFREDLFETDRTAAATNTRARALLVGRTDFGGYAFGLYGGYRNRTNDDLRSVMTRQEQDRTDASMLMETRLEDDLDAQDLRTDLFGIGVETALAGRRWDLAGAVSYQHARGDLATSFLRTSTTDIEQVLSDGVLRVDDAETELQRTTTRDLGASAVDVELIGTLRVGRHRDDYLFGSVTGTLGSGTEDYAASFSDRASFVVLEDGVMISETERDETSSDEGTLELDSQATRVSLGYVYARHKRGLTVLAALNPSAGFAHTEVASIGASPEGVTVNRIQTDQTTLALTLPLYVRFDVTKRLDAFGGGSYTYTYSRSESENIPVSTEAENMTALESTSHAFSSNSALYAGAVVTFRSGLTAQAAFRGDLAAIDGWTVSLSYRF